MPRDLDPRIYNAILETIRKRHPKWIHQEEIYRHLEQSIEFTGKQLALHIQKAGQIEPNWQHAARNLLHTMKRDGTLINPFKNIYGLPLASVTPTALPHWSSVVAKARSIPDRYSVGEDGKITELMSNHSIPRSLVEERVRHLVNCGGALELGALHRWRSIEDALIELIDEVTLLDTAARVVPLVVCTSLLGSDELSEVMASNEARRDESLKSLKAVEAAIPSKKRTVPRDDEKTSKRGGIPFAIVIEDNTRILANSPGVKPTKGGTYYYRCPQCRGFVKRVWPKHFKKHFSHKSNQPENKTCEFYSGSDRDRLINESMRNPLRKRYLASKEFLVSVRTAWGSSSIILEMPIPENTEDISIVQGGCEGIQQDSLAAIGEWEENKGKIKALTVPNATEYKIEADVTIAGTTERMTWKSKGLRGGDLLIADTIDDRTIRRVRPSPGFSSKSTYNDLSQGTYLAYASKIKSLDMRHVEHIQQIGELYLHYFPVQEGIEWPPEWRITEAHHEGRFEVSVAFPIYHKPTNPELIELRPGQDLVVAIRTQEAEDAIEIQWWDSDDESKYLPGDVTFDGWSRHAINSIPNQHNRLQFYLKDTLMTRPTRPIEVVAGINSGFSNEVIERLFENPASVTVHTDDNSESLDIPTFSEEWSYSTNSSFELSSSWDLINSGNFILNYLLEGRDSKVTRKGSGIDEINALLKSIFSRKEQWHEISLDWSSASRKLCGIPNLIIKSERLRPESNKPSNWKPEEQEINELIPTIDPIEEPSEVEAGPPRAKIIKLPKGIKEAAEMAQMSPNNFMEVYVNQSLLPGKELNKFIADFLSCNAKSIKWETKSKLEKSFSEDPLSEQPVKVRCHEPNCKRWIPIPFSRFLKEGQTASRCRADKHWIKKNVRRGGRRR